MTNRLKFGQGLASVHEELSRRIHNSQEVNVLNLFGAKELSTMKFLLSKLGLALFVSGEVSAHLQHCFSFSRMIIFLIL